MPRAIALRLRAVRRHIQLAAEPVGEAQLAPPRPGCVFGEADRDRARQTDAYAAEFDET